MRWRVEAQDIQLLIRNVSSNIWSVVMSNILNSRVKILLFLTLNGRHLNLQRKSSLF